MMTSYSPKRAILSDDDRVALARRIMQPKEQKTIDEASLATGLHPDILRMLVRDRILRGEMRSWNSKNAVCDIEQAEELALHLKKAREHVEGNGIVVTDAATKYHFNTVAIYNWHKNGWITVVGKGRRNARLFNEGDIAFARALTDLRGQASGKSVFPARPRSGRPRKEL